MRMPKANVSAWIAGVSGILLFCLPAFLNRSVLVFADTRSYYVGGHMVIDRAFAIVEHLLHPDTGPLGAVTAHPKAVRSIYYSVATYLLADNASMWAVIIIQAALSVWLISTTMRIVRVGNTPRLLSLLLLMTVFTTLPWSVSMYMPDIFTSLMVLALACLVLGWSELERGTRFGLGTMLAACLVMHFTILPMAVVLSLVAMGMQLRSVTPQFAARWGAIWGATAVAVIAMLFVSVAGFGKWTLAPMNPPFLLARSVADGPAKLYLREHCPQIQLVMCRHLDRLDMSSSDFIWDPNGVFQPASPEEQDAIRAENLPIVLDAAIEHPWLQLRATTADFFDQLFSFSLRDARFPNSAVHTPTDFISTISNSAFPEWLVVLSIVHYLVVGFSCISLAWRWRGLSTRNQQLVVLIVLAVLLNAGTGAVSEPASRYGARIMWLLPLAAVLLSPMRFRYAVRQAASS